MEVTAFVSSSSDRPASIGELKELARYATERVALYRQRVFTGRGVPRRLAELERLAHGANKRLQDAQAAQRPHPDRGNPDEEVD